MTTLPLVELGVLGPLQVRQHAAPVTIPGAKPRAVLTMLGLHGGSVVSADTLIALLWGEGPPRTAGKALQTHISSLRRTLGDGFVLTQGAGWTLAETDVDASRFKSLARLARDAAAAGDTSQAVARFEDALALWRGIPELPDGQRGTSEKTRWIESHAALVEERADALLATGRAAEIIGELEAAVADGPLRERRWCQLMLALYRAGRQGEALGAYQRARALLADELGVDPGPDLRRLEAAIVAQDTALEIPVAQHLPAVTRAVTFLLTDIEGSTAAWEADADAMAAALARHDEIVEQVVTSRGGRLIKTRGEGDATFSVFDRPSAAGAAAIELQEAIVHEPWGLREPMRIRVALHTGEAELRDGDYFGRAVNRAARLRSLAAGGQILCSGATAELVIDSLSDDVVLADLGMRQLRNLARPEHVFELRLETTFDRRPVQESGAPLQNPGLPPVLTGPGPFVGRGHEIELLLSAWQAALASGTNAVLIAGEPGVGKTRLAGEWSRQAHDIGALVIYGRCDEDLGAPYQPFAEALRALVPCLGSSRLGGMRGVEALLPLVPGLTDVLPDLAAPTRADPDTERYALFDAVVALLGVASASAPVVLVLDDLHWAAKPTLLLLRHLLRFGEHARLQIVGTYRSTDLDRSHPLAAMLADLHRDGTASRLQLSGLDESDVTAYVAEAGYDDEELARALASVTGGNPFFLIEALRHVDESGGHWDPSTLPQGVREAVSRRLSRLPAETNKALAAAAVVGSRFAVELVEHVIGDDLVDSFDEACKAGIVIEEPGGHYRFNHALVRQSLLAELPSVRRMRLHQRIATTLENEPGADDELLAELAHHYFECAWAGNAAKAVEYCRRAADQAMARLAYEGAADLYDRALHALEEIDDDLPDRDEQIAVLLVARCEALLAAGDVASAAGAVSQLHEAAAGSARLAAWATCFDGELSMLIHPERLDEIEAALGAAANKLAELDDAAGEAKAHTVHAGCLARLGRIGDCEIALDDALTAARRAREHRRVNAVLAGAPLAALWGPNPVPRAGGRCLDVVRLLRITTDSPAVEATSTRCQAVLEAFRGRASAARRMIDSARRAVAELGLRHALLEIEHFAGIVELVADDPAAAEPHLRKAYKGFRRMGLDADTAETAALLGRTCLALDRDAEADELCTESERLAGHVLKASIAWRTLRAQLLSRDGHHGEARQVGEAAVSLAEHTDLLVDHGDACMALATVLSAAGDGAAAQAAAKRAVGLYERKAAGALADKARGILGERDLPSPPAQPDEPSVEFETACARALRRLDAAVDRAAWDEVEQMIASEISVEVRRKVVGVPRIVMSSAEWAREARHLCETGVIRHRNSVLAVRGERLALTRSELGTEDESPGAPQVEIIRLFGLDAEGRIALHVAFDVEDLDTAIAELDTVHAQFEAEDPKARRMENAASRLVDRYMARFAARDWVAMTPMLADDFSSDDRRHVVNAGLRHGRDTEVTNMQFIAEIGCMNITSTPIAIRGKRLLLACHDYTGPEWTKPNAIVDVVEINTDDKISAQVIFDLNDIDAALAELDARYLAGEAAAHADTWSMITGGHAALNRHEIPPVTTDCVSVDHRRGAAFAPGELIAYVRAGWDVKHDIRTYIEVVHRLSDLGAVYTHSAQGVSEEGFNGEWRGVDLLTVEGDMVNRCEVFDEADIDAAIAKFDQLSRPAPRLENAASRAYDRFKTYFAGRDWGAMTEILADDICTEDRRRVVNSGLREGPDAVVAELFGFAAIGVASITSDIIATRGDHLVFSRAQTWGRGQWSDALYTEVLHLVEVDAYERITAAVAYDLDDIDAAIAELDARYLAGEAAAHAHTWSLIMGGYATLNRGEIPSTATDLVDIDHRSLAPIGPGDLMAYLRAVRDDTMGNMHCIEAVHQLTDLGAVVTHAGKGTSKAGFDAEWRLTALFTVEGDAINRCEIFDDKGLDDALARFDELHRTPRRLENAATRADDRYDASFRARDWDAMAKVFTPDTLSDDRRRIVNAGIRRGRDIEVANMRVLGELGVKNATSVAIATRGERLALSRTRYSGRDQSDEAFHSDLLSIVEIDTDERIVAHVAFDPDDLDAAFEELETRYIAGEAAAHSHTWSVVAAGYAALNRREIPPTTLDWENIDRRRLATIERGGIEAFLRATWDGTPSVSIYISSVHRLSDLGAVVSHASQGTSQEGFEAEWLGISVLTVDGKMLNRGELFDEEDLDAAIARFDELQSPVRKLENAASRVDERFRAHFAARDWNAVASMLADNMVSDDRRRVVSAGRRHGRDATTADLRAISELGGARIASNVIAIRGERLILHRIQGLSRDEGSQLYDGVALVLVEIDARDRITAFVAFDPEDIHGAFEELDARYLAGEAATHWHAWWVISNTYAAFNRRELPAPEWVNLDHRRATPFTPSDLTATIRGSLDFTPDLKIHIEAVHHLSDVGAVLTNTSRGTSQEGFDAEWRMIQLLSVKGDRIDRLELFDEADLDTALAKFDELNRQAPLLENAATRIWVRIADAFDRQDADDVLALAAADAFYEDRRKGLRDDGTARPEVVHAILEATRGWRLETKPIAVRGSGLGLMHGAWRDVVDPERPITLEQLLLTEVNADNLLSDVIIFDADEISGAMDELTARWIASGEVAHPEVIGAVCRLNEAANRHEWGVIATRIADATYLNHRQLSSAGADTITDYLSPIRVLASLVPDLRADLAEVLAHSTKGLVAHMVLTGTSTDGVAIEISIVQITLLEGDRVTHIEAFDHADSDLAVARFEELNRSG